MVCAYVYNFAKLNLCLQYCLCLVFVFVSVAVLTVN